MSRPFIVIGDQTDHGGVVVGSTMTTDTHGKRLARVGDQVTCPKKGHGTTVIVTGDPTMIVDGAPVARHGDKCACGATLISSQFVSTVSDGGGASSGAGVASRTAASGASQNGVVAPSVLDDDLEQFFVVMDELGHPLPGFKYRLDEGQTALHEGALGEDGVTRAYAMDKDLMPTFWRPMGGRS